MSTSSSLRLAPLIVGEVLFDQFEDGRKILGGAPFNVAWNLRGLQQRPTFVSAVGDDLDGKTIRQRMAQWNMDLVGLQTLPGQRTGTVEVSLDQGQPSYEIVFPCAYDFIRPVPLFESADSFSLLYHGSLALRGEQSRETITRLGRQAAAAQVPRFVDINIRQPWFDRQWLPVLVQDAKFVKLNDEELEWLSSMPCQTDDQILRAVQSFRDQHGGEVYFITCGSRGAYAIEGDQLTFAAAPKPDVMVDTVGAGDGFAAATIDGLLRALPYQEVLDRAVQFAARICTLHGATTTDENVYRTI
ncbi:carbohydrate kinase family protein [Novipirellula artificiosorum]|uniref:Ribokinase n=1 Tax=Novipirellula artificiosorum TaxID=2528016 RepID=A0A5C6CRP8_9BACT|nr:carbohydrate kinase [Novipirellula artificiosorum]TWU25479.1 Ribokinase [Novipirellula artificiosorum]